MAGNKNRSRTVVFRLTPDEFARMKEVSAARGARSLSEFARTKVMRGEDCEPSLTDIDKKLDNLAGEVQRLTRILDKA